MRKRIMRSLALVPAILVLTVGVAIALDQTNGSGLTHQGASIGFNAKADLRGEITYTSHDGTGFQVMCRDGLTAYRNLKPTALGYLRTRVTATCTDQDGNTIYVEIYFVDRGEPGDRDVERIYFTYDAAFALDANSDPDVYNTVCNTGVVITEGCMDRGIIQAGNVQIHQDPDLQETLVIGADATV
jgi:hypothetical protein